MSGRADYGIDAPGVVRLHLIGGGLLAVIAVAGFARPGLLPAWGIAAVGFVAAIVLGFAGVMLWSSLVGKKRVCDRLVAALAPSGSEQVLDAGCGRGLALLACARRLTTGRAVGIDLWSAGDLSANRPEAVLANARAEGVSDRVTVETGDITALPFPDASFDAVISMTVLHNIPTRSARDRAVRELARVLRPGGRMAVFDLLHTARYAEILRAAGLHVDEIARDRLWLMPCRSLLAQKPSIA